MGPATLRGLLYYVTGPQPPTPGPEEHPEEEYGDRYPEEGYPWVMTIAQDSPSLDIPNPYPHPFNLLRLTLVNLKYFRPLPFPRSIGQLHKGTDGTGTSIF